MGQRKNLHKASVSKTETLFHFEFLVQVNHTKENLLKFQTNTMFLWIGCVERKMQKNR